MITAESVIWKQGEPQRLRFGREQRLPGETGGLLEKLKNQPRNNPAQSPHNDTFPVAFAKIMSWAHD